MNRSTLARDIQFLRAKPGDGVARFDHLNSMTAKRSKSPAHQPMGVPTRSLSPTPAWVWDPHRPGWRMNVPDPAVPVLRSVPGVGHTPEA